MRQRDFKTLGVALIIMAFICISGGFIVGYLNDTNFVNPSAILGKDDSSGITVSTYEDGGADGLSSSADSNGNVENNSGNNTATTDEEKPTTPNNGSSDNTTTSNTNNDENSTSTQPSTPTQTYAQKNDALRKEIEKTYGITIYYGSETAGYSVGGLTTLTIGDDDSINKALNDLKNCLANFPINIWKEISDGGFPLTFYLIRCYSATNVTGVTESYTNKANISIAINFPFAETFNHEVYHYLENYIISFKGASYNNWNSFNPTTFTYGSVNSSLSYTRTFKEDSYFVNDYAQTEEGEDRASTFEYMMGSSKASCLNNNKPVWKKAKYMSEQLDYYLKSVSPTVIETWEQYL